MFANEAENLVLSLATYKNSLGVNVITCFFLSCSLCKSVKKRLTFQPAPLVVELLEVVDGVPRGLADLLLLGHVHGVVVLVLVQLLDDVAHGGGGLFLLLLFFVAVVVGCGGGGADGALDEAASGI